MMTVVLLRIQGFLYLQVKNFNIILFKITLGYLDLKFPR